MASTGGERLPVEGKVSDRLLEQLAGNERMAELGRLSAGIIHEINTPLSVIAAASQMILNERDIPEPVTEMVERIYQEVQRLSGLTRSILGFSRDEDALPADTDVSMIIRDVLAFLKYEVQKRSVSITEVLAPDLPSLVVNPNHLKQIFLNLIVNALQAVESGGAIVIAGVFSDDGFIRIEISDTGPGIPGEHLQRIFDPFFTTKGAEEGTGLGLYVTRKHVEGMGGRIEVASEPGKGTCFTLIFPVSTCQ